MTIHFIIYKYIKYNGTRIYMIVDSKTNKNRKIQAQK